MKNNPLLMTDGYKTSHHLMYPKGTTLVYSNYTPRNVKYMPEGAKDVVVFGNQYVIKFIHELYEENFFSQDKSKVCNEAKTFLSSYLSCDYDVSHFESLHDLGYLPIILKGLEEGRVVKAKIPTLVIYNTLPEFFWLPNFLETLISSLLWKPMHSASMAFGYRKILMKWANKTDKDNLGFVDFQAHDFSFRGMQSPEASISSGLGFLSSFMGTDTIPTLQAAKHYYNSENVAFSVPASEHSVMTAYGKENEIDGFKRLMQQFPTGILSVVSDSFDLWKVCTEYLSELKAEILERDGKLVIRPDSGDPVDIICGLELSQKTNFDSESPASKGVVELLWDIFGGNINDQGFKVLDSHIGCIYGDSITMDRAEQICERLATKGFASTNVVFGVGSYSMGYATRDNQGGAIKATYCEVDGIGREIFKDPITDDGTKKSAKGLIKIEKNNGNFILVDQVNWEDESKGELKLIYKNGKFIVEDSLNEIRNRLK